MIEFILQSRIKYFVVVVLGIIFLVFVLHRRHKISEDEEIRNYHEEIAIREAVGKARQLHSQHQQIHGGNDWNVQFYSGKQMADEVDSEKKLFQVHTVTIENVGNVDVELECKDVFSKFGGKLTPGSQHIFQVTDLFHKRHYWCEAIFFPPKLENEKPNNPKFKPIRNRLIGLEDSKEKKKSFIFRAYGEGAPRDNNHISLKSDGAFINGENMVFTKES